MQSWAALMEKSRILIIAMEGEKTKAAATVM